MNNFSECYEDDLEYAFFDLDDFATTHVIDGKECEVVLIENSRTDAKMSYGLMKATLNPKETAINKITHILFIRESDVRKKLTANALLVMDGKKYFVQSVILVKGVYQIALGIHAV